MMSIKLSKKRLIDFAWKAMKSMKRSFASSAANGAASFQRHQPSHVLLELPQSRRKTMANFEKLLLQYRVAVTE